MNSKLGIKQFRTEGCISYLVFDQAEKKAALIDPHLEFMAEYRDYLASGGLKLIWVLDTHVHADHASATHLISREFKVPVIMSKSSTSKRVTRPVSHGDVLELGGLKFRVLDTPGHTPDSISIEGEGLVFTGDTLLIGASGRTDFGGSDPSAEWNSIREVLGKLLDATLVLPGHDYSDLLFSTIGNEKKKNSHWNFPSEKNFVAMKLEERIDRPSEEIKKILDFNLSTDPGPVSMGATANVTFCGKSMGEVGPYAAISVEKYEVKLKEKSPQISFLDVREPDEFRAGHIPGVENIPLSEIGIRLQELLSKKRIYVSCKSGGRSQWAAKTLCYLGHPDIVNVTGGLQAWMNRGLSVDK